MKLSIMRQMALGVTGLRATIARRNTRRVGGAESLHHQEGLLVDIGGTLGLRAERELQFVEKGLQLVEIGLRLLGLLLVMIGRLLGRGHAVSQGLGVVIVVGLKEVKGLAVCRLFLCALLGLMRPRVSLLIPLRTCLLRLPVVLPLLLLSVTLMRVTRLSLGRRLG